MGFGVRTRQFEGEHASFDLRTEKRYSIVLLPCPSARLKIVQTPDILPPVSFMCHFRKLAVLNLQLRMNSGSRIYPQ